MARASVELRPPSLPTRTSCVTSSSSSSSPREKSGVEGQKPGGCGFLGSRSLWIGASLRNSLNEADFAIIHRGVCDQPISGPEGAFGRRSRIRARHVTCTDVRQSPDPGRPSRGAVASPGAEFDEHRSHRHGASSLPRSPGDFSDHKFGFTAEKSRGAHLSCSVGPSRAGRSSSRPQGISDHGRRLISERSFCRRDRYSGTRQMGRVCFSLSCLTNERWQNTDKIRSTGVKKCWGGVHSHVEG